VGAGRGRRRAARSHRRGRNLALRGFEIDPGVRAAAGAAGLAADDLAAVALRDFLDDPPEGRFPAIVANPPYLRHHRLPAERKARLAAFAAETLGERLDGRAGLHVHFLVRALTLLAPGGRLAFIVPADVCEGVFAPALWRWIAREFRVDGVVAFAPEATPFPGVDTNPLILLIRKARPGRRLFWAVCTAAVSPGLRDWLDRRVPDDRPRLGLRVESRTLVEGLATGLSRPPAGKSPGSAKLGEFARVVRGIATGANRFFLLTRRQANELGLSPAFLRPAISRTRDVAGDSLTSADLDALDAAGRPTLLFAPDGRALDAFPRAERAYLAAGAAAGLPERPLIATRRPWYRMERRDPPPILFAYLGRRRARFVRNLAGALPLTGFLVVSPRSDDPAFVAALWDALRRDDVAAGLAGVGKSYGGGAIKVEPRALERLPIPPDAAAALRAEA
jgi:hypothetical protein